MFKRILSLFIASIMIFSVFYIGASANSAQTWWKGSDASGVITTNTDCPVTVKNEVLTFNIDNFPETYYRNKEDMIGYTSFVTAQYTFYNPSKNTVTARLLFPFGEKPMYFTEYYDYQNDEYISFDDTQRYEIILNGEPVKKTLRYTLNSGTFNTETALSEISDKFISDSFYYPELPVTRYTFVISGVDTDTYHAATAGFDIDKNSEKTKYYFTEESGYRTLDDGKVRLSTWVKNGDKLTVYVMGEEPSEFPEWTVYEDGGTEDRERIDGNIKLTDKFEMTFYDLVFSEYDEDSDIPETDWYNAVLKNLNMYQSTDGAILKSENAFDIKKSLLRWYEYEITIPPEEEVINTVSAPIYPEIDSGYSPAVYDYLYLLSPAKTWADFGNIDININTPYYLVSSEGFEFTETDGGYTLSLEGLPETELSFRLSTAEFPKRPQKHITDILPVEILIMLSVMLLIIILITAVIIIIRKRKRKTG